MPTTFSAVQVIAITEALVMAAFLSDLEKIETVNRFIVVRDLNYRQLDNSNAKVALKPAGVLRWAVYQVRL